MSGGVDSSVSAALLKKEGYDITGVFMKLCSGFDEKQAQKVAKKLGIPFYVFNFEKEFKKKVVDYFLRVNKLGLTPNPCVVCNKEIKFGLLLEKALVLGADYIATGHYARLQHERLLKARDKNKDQTYFLWRLNQKILKRVLFPVGDYTKTEVRKLAKKFRLPTANATESQEICFIQTTINDFLRKHLKSKPGKIVDPGGNILGEHQGLCFYTIGQRKGIKLPGGPFYVLDKDLKKNLLIVSKNEKDYNPPTTWQGKTYYSLYKKELIAKEINWISGKAPKLPLKVMAKIRYRHEPTLAIVNKGKIVFPKPQRAVTPGQSVVFYKGQELLGGGIII